MKRVFYLFFLQALLLSSCSRQLESLLPDLPDQLSLECYISPEDTVITAVLSRATSFSETEVLYKDLFIADANITIDDGETTIVLGFNPDNHFYQARVSEASKIRYGKTYSLSVLTADGKKLTASCTVPDHPLTIEKIEVETFPRGSDFIDVRVKWQADQASYYMIRPFYYHNRGTAGVSKMPHRIQFFENSDKEFVSNHFSYDIRNQERKATVFIYTLDKNYFDYMRSVLSNIDNQTDPFARPANVIHTIEGGFGCFGAYTVTRIDHKL